MGTNIYARVLTLAATTERPPRDADNEGAIDGPGVQIRHGVAGPERDRVPAEEALAGDEEQTAAGEQAVLSELLLAGPHGDWGHQVQREAGTLSDVDHPLVDPCPCSDVKASFTPGLSHCKWAMSPANWGCAFSFDLRRSLVLYSAVDQMHCTEYDQFKRLKTRIKKSRFNVYIL
jgi:hypothetical protein